MSARTATLLSALALLGAATPALADRTITVDGVNTDWVGVTSCFTEPSGDGSGGIDLNRACLENDNASGNAGRLYAEFEATANFPTNQDVYFGFVIDNNQDGQITDVDEAWAIYFPDNTGNTPASLQVFSATTFQFKREFTSTAACGGSGTANGWSGRRNGRIAEMSVAYGCLGLTNGADERLFRLGTYPNFDLTGLAFYNGTTGTLEAAIDPPDVGVFTALAKNASVTLTWTNPSAHRGVVILRTAGATAPSTVPTDHTAYTVGQTLGNATVRYVDDGSTVSTFTDTGLTNGTRYNYKIYNHHQIRTYSAGSAPTTTGLFAYPTSRTSGSPLWCYSTGVSNLTQPVTELGSAIYSGGNLGAITSNLTTPSNVATDGTERYRPVVFGGAIQGRFLVMNITGGPAAKVAMVGDQSGHAYAVNTQTGALLWTGNGGAVLGDAIQGSPVAQLYPFGNAAYQAAFPNTDLVFFATRNTSRTSNKVYALRASNGTVAWTYQPGNMDYVSGGMMLDYSRNRLWVVARDGASGNQNSLRVLNSLTGAVLSQTDQGAIDNSIVRDYGVSPSSISLAYLVDNSGNVRAFDLQTMAQVWTVNVGAMNAYPFPVGSGFIASLTGDRVERWSVLPASPYTKTRMWQRTIADPTGVRIDYGSQKVFVGSSDGKVHQLNVDTGVDEKQISLTGTSSFGTPTIDDTAGVMRLHVGTADGRICAFQLPLP